MKTCKVRPSESDCQSCMDVADFFDGNPDCRACRELAKRYELLDVKPGILNDYAFVVIDGECKKISLDRVYDIKDEEKG